MTPERRLYSRLTQPGGYAEERDLAAIREALREAEARAAYKLGLEHGGAIHDLIAQRDRLWTALGECARAAEAAIVAGDNDGAIRWRNALIELRARTKAVLGG